MSGTVAGAKKSVKVIKAKYGKDHYSKIGRLGGAAKVAKGYSMNRELAKTSGVVGGQTSKRRPRARTVAERNWDWDPTFAEIGEAQRTPNLFKKLFRRK